MNMKSLRVSGRGHVLAKLSEFVYQEPDEAKTLVNDFGFHTFEYYNRDGAQAYRFESDTDVVFACRGTEPGNFNDMLADLDARKEESETVGKVHKGFKREADDIWEMIYEDLVTLNDDKRNLWFTGHSLGAAMITIMASRAWEDDALPDPIELHTFGSPRAGDAQFADSMKNYKHYRWVNNNDIVTMVPPAFMGFKHAGTEKYINSDGIVAKVGFWKKLMDRWNGIMGNKMDMINDHTCSLYAKHCKAN